MTKKASPYPWLNEKSGTKNMPMVEKNKNQSNTIKEFLAFNLLPFNPINSFPIDGWN